MVARVRRNDALRVVGCVVTGLHGFVIGGIRKRDRPKLMRKLRTCARALGTCSECGKRGSLINVHDAGGGLFTMHAGCWADLLVWLGEP